MVRLVDTDLERPQLTAAIDEALLESRLAGRCGDTIHLYRRRPPSVSIGYFQSAERVADLEACRRDGVPVVRRISAGGAIYTDERQLVYALAFRPPRPIGAKEGLAIACGALVRALTRLGVGGATMAGFNDVLVEGGKVSGSAQVIRKGVHLVHGTVLVDSDMMAMTRYLRALPGEDDPDGHPVPSSRLTTLAHLMGSPPSMAQVKEAVVKELAAAVGGAPEIGPLLVDEVREAARLEEERYANSAWTLKR
jgi:lipoate-protein ligase A